MAYKDKQREANKAAAKRHRQGMTKGMTDNGNVTPCVIPKTFTDGCFFGYDSLAAMCAWVGTSRCSKAASSRGRREQA